MGRPYASLRAETVADTVNPRCPCDLPAGQITFSKWTGSGEQRRTSLGERPSHVTTLLALLASISLAAARLAPRWLEIDSTSRDQ